ncbi:hypothetical protein Aab01nite_38340 [Paractinoplanes abujensis]|uniref:Uncharacterized protein n=1 Tax=Paractinoplanes abujensis TaxID=882441 RepID=A0A7W7CTQ8_9ACTN|nr:hypothetical protein [Actinoplanes abujensis]MBB4694542.1 hypothetical protein [Actinoplanes abujensis]GID20244.1 hypothetical protein Aab01nite_38340 [Actinoplanes abujensis]
MPSELHIGMDDEKTVLSPYALRLRTGRARRHRSGSVTEVVPMTPSGVTREARVAFAARLSLPLIFASALFFAAGVPWWLPFAASVATVTTVWRRQARAAQIARFERPVAEGGRVLVSPKERAAFARAVAVSRRIRRTWPGLPGMIDPEPADRSLTRALDDLAALLVRRQELRRLQAGLEGVSEQDVPADSPAVLALAAQRDRALDLWRETGEQADRILRSLDRAALAGESFLREREIGEAARRAGLVLAGLAGVPGTPAAESGPELADRTAAVITAYRELAEQCPEGRH